MTRQVRPGWIQDPLFPAPPVPAGPRPMVASGGGSTSPVLYLGSHKPHWLWRPEAAWPLFVSHRTLGHYRKLRRATHRWALDSGGFTELAKYGRWVTRPREYVAAVARYQQDVGLLDWAAPQDWMREPAMIHGGMIGKVRAPGTGLSVSVHQHLTVLNYVELCGLWPEESDGRCPFIPVLQGWTIGDYDNCAGLYAAAGVNLAACPVVGLGSVCRRQNSVRIGTLVSWLAASGLRLHGFGVKTEGLGRYGEYLSSCDSLAWSYDARRNPPLPGHPHKSCANCLPYAAAWRRRLLDGEPPSALATAA